MIRLRKDGVARAVSAAFDASGAVRTEFAQEELDKLTNLSWAGHGEGEAYTWWKPLSSLGGIEHCRRITELDLNDNAFGDLSPLEALTELTSLGLTDCANVEDLGPLSGLIGLKQLYLYGTPATSLEPLAALSQLVHLSLGNTLRTELAVLRELPDLQKLTYRATGLDDEDAQVLLDLADRGVTLLVHDETQRAMDRLAVQRSGVVDDVAVRLRELGLDEIADRWLLLGTGADEGGSVLHTLVVAGRKLEDEVVAEAIETLTGAGVPVESIKQYGGNALYELLQFGLGDRALAAMLSATVVLDPPLPPFGAWNAHMRRPEIPVVPPTPMALAIAKAPHRVQALIDAGARLTHPAAVVAICKAGDAELLARALEEGADPNRRWGEGMPLFSALGKDHVGLVSMLLEAGADAHRWRWGNISSRPIHSARSVEAVGLLLEAGVDVSARDAHGRTALHSVARKLKMAKPPFEVLLDLAQLLLTLIPATSLARNGTVLTRYADDRGSAGRGRHEAYHELFGAVLDAGADPLLPRRVHPEYLPAAVKKLLAGRVPAEHKDFEAMVVEVMGDPAVVVPGTRAFVAMGTLLETLEGDPDPIQQRLEALLSEGGDSVAEALLGAPRGAGWRLVAFGHLHGGALATGKSIWEVAVGESALLDALLEGDCPTEYIDPSGYSAHHILVRDGAPLEALRRLGPPSPDTMPCAPLGYLCAMRAAEEPAFVDYIREHDLDLSGPAGEAARLACPALRA